MKLTVLMVVFCSFLIDVSENQNTEPVRHFNTQTMALSEPLKINTKITIKAEFVDVVWCSVYVGTDEVTPAYLSVLGTENEVITSNYLDKTYYNYQKRPLNHTYEVGSPFQLDIVIKEKSTIFTLQGMYEYELPHHDKIKPFDAERIEVHNFKDVSISIDRSKEDKESTSQNTTAAKREFNVASYQLLEPLRINTKITITAVIYDIAWCSVYLGTEEITPVYLTVDATKNVVITSNYMDRTFFNYLSRPLKHAYEVGSPFQLDIVIKEKTTNFMLQGIYLYEQPHHQTLKPFDAEWIEVHNFKNVSFTIDRSNEDKTSTTCLKTKNPVKPTKAVTTKNQNVEPATGENSFVSVHLLEPLKINTKITITAQIDDIAWCSVYLGTEEITPAYITVDATKNVVITSNYIDRTFYNYQNRPLKHPYELGSPYELEIVIEEKATIFKLQGKYLYEQPHHEKMTPFDAEWIEVHNFRNVSISIDRSNEVKDGSTTCSSLESTNQQVQPAVQQHNFASMHLLEPLKVNTKVTITAVFDDIAWCSVYLGTDDVTPAYLTVDATKNVVITSNYIDKLFYNYQKRPLKYPYKVGSPFKIDIVIKENSTVFTLQDEYAYEQPHHPKLTPFDVEWIEVHNFRNVSFSIDRSKEIKVFTTHPTMESIGKCRRSDMVSLSPYDNKWKFEYYTVKNEMESTNVDPDLHYDILDIQKIFNTCLWNRFLERKDEISLIQELTNVKMLFHGSPDARHFALYGFDEAPVAGKTYNEGFLFAYYSSQSNDYVQPQSDGNRYMLLCRVALGRIKNQKSSAKRSPFAPVGYHSVQQTLRGPDDEYIVHSKDQIFPSYLITYRIR